MFIKDGQEFYTFRDVMAILSVSQSRLMKAMDKHVLIPTDIEPCGGRKGFRYLFSREEVSRYAQKIGFTPDFSRVEAPTKPEDLEHEKKVMEARREVRRVVDPKGQIADGTLITEDNVKEVFAQIQAQAEPMHVMPPEKKYEPLDFYLVKLGNAYINPHNSVPLLEFEMRRQGNLFMDREKAIDIQQTYGGQIIQLFMKEIQP